MELLSLPFFSELEPAKRVLVAGAGGGFDVLCGLPLYFALRAAGKTVHLANLSLRLGRQVRWDSEKEEIISDREASQMLVRPYRAPWDAELKSLGVGS